MSTLYRKYRPQSFQQICGQNHIKITLENELKTGHTAHAYLFCGPRAVGKTTIARLVAKSLNCENRKDGEAEPCNACQSCLSITEGRNIDVMEIDAASHTGVDNVRENIISAAKTSSSGSKYKVFIIDEVHMLSVSSFNALLKTLEEPPHNVVFVLCTTEVHKIPATIISRCERFDFKRISIKDISDKLALIAKEEGVDVDDQILRNIAKHSGGHMRDAESLFGQIISIGGNKITDREADIIIPRSDLSEVVKLISFLANKNAAAGVSLVNRILDEGIDLREFIGDLIETLRKLMLVKVNPSLTERTGLDFSEGLERDLLEIGRGLDLGRIVSLLEKMNAIHGKIKDSFITQLPLEIAIVELCSEKNYPHKKNESTAIPLSNNLNSSIVGNLNKDLRDDPQADLTFEDLISKWHEVIAIIKSRNNSLVTILISSKLEKIERGTVFMVFKYKFHKDRIDDPNVRGILKGVLQEVFGMKLEVETRIDENMEINITATESVSNDNEKNSDKAETESGGASMMNDLLKTFGGKVVG